MDKKIAIIGGRDFKNKKLLDAHMQIYKAMYNITHVISAMERRVYIFLVPNGLVHGFISNKKDEYIMEFSEKQPLS